MERQVQQVSNNDASGLSRERRTDEQPADGMGGSVSKVPQQGDLVQEDNFEIEPEIDSGTRDGPVDRLAPSNHDLAPARQEALLIPGDEFHCTCRKCVRRTNPEPRERRGSREPSFARIQGAARFGYLGSGPDSPDSLDLSLLQDTENVEQIVTREEPMDYSPPFSPPKQAPAPQLPKSKDDPKVSKDSKCRRGNSFLSQDPGPSRGSRESAARITKSKRGLLRKRPKTKNLRVKVTVEIPAKNTSSSSSSGSD